MTKEELGIAIVAAPGDAAGAIARAIVESKLAACAQVTPDVTSLYWWKGRIEEARESLIILKTERSRMDSIRELLKSVHPYEVPELLFFPIAAGNPDYLAWLGEVLVKKI